MNLLPTQTGARPRLACELSGAAVVCGRSESATTPVSAVAKAELAQGAIVPGLRPGNVVDRVAVIAAVRRAMEGIGAKPGRGNPFLTLVIPDAAVRVLLLDFDALPGKLTEALPLVRFRLKKLVPFDADDAMVTYQVMSQSKSVTRVLAVAMPRDVLAEYESVAREAGFEPGAVLPSTLAVLAGLTGAPNSAANEETDAALVVNAGPLGVTTAIVKAGILLLHRSVDLVEHMPLLVETPAAPAIPTLPAELFEGAERLPATPPLTIVDHDETIGEWAAQEPLPEHGRNPYVDREFAEAEVQVAESHGGLTGMSVPPTAADFGAFGAYGGYAQEPAPVSRSPYAGATVAADLNAELHHAMLDAPTSPGTFTDPGYPSGHAGRAAFAPEAEEPVVHTLAPDTIAEELARAVSVAVAYFEDTLAVAPRTILSAGAIGAERLNRVLQTQGIAEAEGVRVRELVDPAALGAVNGVARGALAGVVGALRG